MAFPNEIHILGQPAWSWRKEKTGHRDIHIDPTTHGVLMVGAEHHEIHEGHMWHVDIHDLDVDAGTPNATNDMCIHVATAARTDADDGSDGPYVHMAASVYCSDPAIVTLYEAPSSVGTKISDLVLVNRNRNETGVSLVDIDRVESYGTDSDTVTLATRRVGSTGNPVQRTGGDARTAEEWVLKPGTSYIVHVDVDGADTEVLFSMDLYEHYHKDNWDEALIMSK